VISFRSVFIRGNLWLLFGSGCLVSVFDYEYEEIGKIVKKSNSNCRQLLLRAKRHLTSGPSRFKVPPELLERLARQFASSCANGDLSGLVSVLS